MAHSGPPPLLLEITEATAGVAGKAMNSASTVVTAPVTSTVQLGVLPWQAPLQPANANPDAGVAVSKISCPGVTEAKQLPGQLSAAPVALIVPPPGVTGMTNSVGFVTAA